MRYFPGSVPGRAISRKCDIRNVLLPLPNSDARPPMKSDQVEIEAGHVIGFVPVCYSQFYACLATSLRYMVS